MSYTAPRPGAALGIEVAPMVFCVPGNIVRIDTPSRLTVLLKAERAP
ncbi:hypothetical protein TAMC210_15760 [Thermanaeromonas sp. C210]|nr:hypothetical protein TAMC210_15760 [Thermanaeromonas sp. C210]